MKFKNKILIALIILMLISSGISIFFYKKYQNATNRAEIHKNNINALNDTLKQVKNKADELEFQKQTLQLESTMKISELKSLNSELASELEKEKNNQQIKYINKSKNEINTDTIKIDTTKYNQLDSNKHKFNFTHNDSTSDYSLSFNGITNFSTNLDTNNQISFNNINTIINNINFKFDLIHGIRETNGEYTSFVRSPYDGFKVRNMNSAITVDKPEPDKFIIGPSIGPGYGFRTGKLDVFAGINLTYKIFGF